MIDNIDFTMLSNYQVMKSNAGYYVGREYLDPEIGGFLPYDRVSNYFKTREQAQKYLEKIKQRLNGKED